VSITLTAISNAQDLANRVGITAEEVETLTSEHYGNTRLFIDAILVLAHNYEDQRFRAALEADAAIREEEDHPF